FALDAWRQLRRHIGIARENVVDLMDRDFLGVHFGGNLRCGLLVVLFSAPSERRDAGRKQAKKWISHQPGVAPMRALVERSLSPGGGYLRVLKTGFRAKAAAAKAAA